MSTDITPRGDLVNPRPEIRGAANQLDTALFLVRLWQVGIVAPEAAANGGPGKEEMRHWHGKVQHVIRGEARSFTDWDTMVGCFKTMLAHEPAEPSGSDGD